MIRKYHAHQHVWVYYIGYYHRAVITDWRWNTVLGWLYTLKLPHRKEDSPGWREALLATDDEHVGRVLLA